MTAPEPSACRWCGIPQRGHGRQYVPEVGWHKHTPPTTAQIKQRMHDHRTARRRAL